MNAREFALSLYGDKLFEEHGGTRERPLQARKRDLISEARAAGCVVCGEDRLPCIDFHHVDRATKRFTVCEGWYRQDVSLEDLQFEIAKCVPVCANCHRCFHAGLVELPPQA